jgi:hypothetical protein
MTTAFTVNQHDLEFVLRQIKIAEDHSARVAANPNAGAIAMIQAIQAEYGVTAANAAILPYGLRTVDGRDNNLLVDRDYGASLTQFPRLLDESYRDGGPETPFQAGPNLVTNTDYANIGQSVVDTDPRTISNLIVDQTPANPAAVMAALRLAGIEGVPFSKTLY